MTKSNSRSHKPPARGNKSKPLAPKKDNDKLKWSNSQPIILAPEGYVNAGQPVDVGRVSVISDELKTTVGLSGEKIQTGVQSELVDLGMTTPVDMGDRVIDMGLAEYMRSREIEFSGKAFMPGATLYPFFDGVNVEDYCKPKKADGTYGNYGDPLVCNSKGGIEGIFKIPNDTSVKFKTGTKAFRLTTSTSNQTNPPPASFAEAKYHATGWVTTKQKTTYSTRASTLNITSVSRNLGPISTEGSMLEWGSPCPRDPISESFFVYDEGGCFITAIDVFFYKKPSDPNKPQSPVILQLRDLAPGGNPSTTVLPMGEVVKDADEIVINHFDGQRLTVTGNTTGVEGITKGPWTNTTEIKADSGNTIQDGVSFISTNPALDMIPTRFTFKSPIYVAQNTSYCFVLLSDSNEYNVWVAQSGPDVTGRDGVDAFRNIGEVNTEIGTSNPIQKDPYIQGVYFKSQNGISWTPDQTIDIKFKIWKAKFKTERTGEVDFVNGDLPLDVLTRDPFQFTQNNLKVRVIHPGHGHTIGSKVVFQNVSGDLLGLACRDDRYDDDTNSGRNVMNRVSGHWITKVELDSYLIDLSLDPDQPYSSGATIAPDLWTKPTSNGKVGGAGVTATSNVRCDELMLLTTALELPQTTVKWNLQTTSSQGVNEDTNTPYEILPRINISPNNMVVFDRPMHVSSYINEHTPLDTIPGPSQADGSLGGEKSIQVRAILSSSNPNLSPVLDESRFSVVCSANRIDNPTGHIPVGSSVNPNCVINDDYDLFQCLPPTVVPLISDLSNKVYFTSSTGTLTGTLDLSNGTSVTGTGTKFLTELSPGDVIKDSTTGEERFVVSISSNISMTINAGFDTGSSSSTVLAEPPPMRIKTFDDTVARHLAKLDIGKLITITGATGDRNCADVYVLEVNYTPDNTIDDDDMGSGKPCLCEIVVDHRPKQAKGFQNSSFTLVQKDRYIDEIAPNSGSVSAKYLSKVLTLANASNALKVMFDAYRHSSNTIDLYYRVKEIDDPTDITNTNWTLAEFNLDKNGELVTTIPSPNDDMEEFSAYEANIQGLPSFSAVQIKIVMRGGNPARIPRVKKLVVIALEE